jgi:structural maintenance of chromosome 4
MSQVSPARPRRGAQRKTIVDSSDEENNVDVNMEQSEEEDTFTPAPVKTARRPPRRNVPATPQSVDKSRMRDGSVTNDIDASLLASTTKKPPPTGRRSVRAGRKSIIPVIAEVPTLLPTPEASTSPEPPPTPAQTQTQRQPPPTPLADITEAAINEQAPSQPLPTPAEKVKQEPERQAFEKPMDIVIRARAKGITASQEPAPPKSRLVITYLILTNFKSYAGRQEVGPFHSSFSSVVGPNGSGKSNVIDSLLFVFGFRASKMRQGKISALIHNSAAFPDLEFCEVEVRFQEVMDRPAGGCDVLPNSDLIISRRAYKNNSSRYFINGSESNFTTVTTLLKEQGIDLDHKRFLILQGEVESIAQMKPKAATEHDDGLLEYLEDIIGTSKYKTPIEESTTEAEGLNEVCLEKQTRVQHVEKEKQSLEGKKDTALAFIRDENELATKQSELYQLYVAECEDNIVVANEAVGQLQGLLDAELERHKGSESEITDIKKQHASQVKQFEKIEQATQATLKQLAKVDKESVKFEEKRKHLATKVKKLEKTKSTSQSAANEAAAALERLEDDLERNGNMMTEVEQTLQVEEQELQVIRDNLQGKTQGLSAQITKKQEALQPWQEQINAKESAIAVAQSELAILRERDEAGAQAVTDIQARLARIQEERAAKVNELDAHHAEHKSLSKQVQRLEASMQELVKAEPEARSKVSSARQKADEARATLAQSQSQGAVLSGLMRLKESGRIDGFHGRLGNLGTIDPKFDVAISTACPALDNLVVDSVEVGQVCIDYLRKNNLGRANFILLDRLSQRDLTPIETPENVPRLFDLVKAKHDKFRPAFYNVLQNTVVANDLEHANRIAYGAKRWRVVTVDGQLIDKSGTMSGGGTAKAKGKMSSKLVAETTKQQVEKLEAERETSEQTFRDYQQERQEAEAELRRLNDQLPQCETTIQKCKLEVESLEKNAADAERRQVELSSGKQPKSSDAGRVKSLEATMAGLETEIEKLIASTSGIEAEIAALQDKIMEIGGVKLRGQKAKVDSLKEQIKSLTQQISAAEVDKAKAEQQKKKNERALHDALKEMNALAGETEALEEEARQQNKDTSALRQQAEEAQEVCQALGLSYPLTDIETGAQPKT